MTDTFDAVLAELRQLAAPSRYPLIGNGNVRSFADRLSAAHAAEVEALRASRDAYRHDAEALLQISKGAQTALEAAERDARRYRWLRAADWERRSLSVPYVLAGQNFPESDEHLSGEPLDAAIDAAIATTEGAP